ncbi:lipase family protein [Nocardia jejuensis]|uniref:lipase family protein n=1 Tax=Nocardia jejuensis TaxID=328049 RepID=UPI00083134DD|nr:lipase family protein [Nocardia jejuensis]
MNTRNQHHAFVLRGLCAAAMAATLATGNPALAAPADTTVATPDLDPFYATPPDLDSYPDGAILRSRESALFGLPLPISVWQIQYRSSDARGAATTGVTTVLVPGLPWTGAGARPVVSYQMAEDGLGVQCASSYMLRSGYQPGAQNDQTSEGPLTALLLQRNWAVVVSDYEGPQERFLDRAQEAHSALDGIRAALAFAPAGLAADSPVAAFGYSGGAFATVSMMEIQPGYAPELNVTGFAAGGIPADLVAGIRHDNGTANAGLAVFATAALDRLRPDLNIVDHFDDAGRAAITTAGNQCVQQTVADTAYLRLTDTTGSTDPGTVPALVIAAAQQNPGQAVPTAPMYAWHSTLDDALPIDATDSLVDRYCAAGASVTYHRTDVPQHAPAAVAELPAVLDYLGERLAGAPIHPGCRTF